MDPTHWAYKGEGNANLVLSYVGPEAALMGRVLRLRKATDDDLDASEHSPFTLDYELGFQRHVIAPLLGAEYVAPADLVDVSLAFLEEISRRVSAARPPGRRSRPLDLSQPHAVLIKDLTYVPQRRDGKAVTTIAVEIKPKWGFLPTSPLIAPEHAVKRRTCRYCMHQQWKAKVAATAQNPPHAAAHDGYVANTFCPLDLYSRDRARVRAAFDALLPNPQNNLRLFVDGQPTLLDSDQARKTLAEQFQAGAADAMDTLFEHLTNILVSDNLLPRLQHHQRGLDPHDIEGVFPLYEAMPETQQTAVPTLEEWRETIDAYCANANAQPSDAENRPLFSASTKATREYLVSATLKDCSVIITLWLEGADQNPPTEPNEGTIPLPDSPDGDLLRYKIGVLDVDPKRAAKIPAHFTLDRDIVEHYIETGIEKLCQE
ncbi:Inositol-pentakisphosphate 2-kinase [Geranomyces variabilis]|nr:Inositol-pentakisphosphate 2-kinase [Geranomyces variabilis]